MPAGLELVLDDYHLADGPEIAAGVAFLLEHLPPQVHLVISTRADPALPLARLRARGELVEVRAADLRFTLDEAAAYLSDVTGLELTRRRRRRAGGPDRGLDRCAAAGGPVPAGTRRTSRGFIAGFAGDDRYIVDYLVEEVLRRQPDRSAPSCSTRRSSTGSAAPLRRGHRRRAAARPCSSRSSAPTCSSYRSTISASWYRYHHLFADVLRAHLLEERPDEVAELHRRAAGWYAAARHAGRGDPARARRR